jgi:hypothetical protein
MVMDKNSHLSNWKLYAIQFDDCCNFVTGLSAQGEQVLMGVVGQVPLHVVAVFFDKTGGLLRVEKRDVTFEDERRGSHAQHRQEQSKSLWRALDAWRTEIGFLPGVIQVAKFHLSEWDSWGNGIGLCELPEHLQDFIDNQSSVEDEQFCQELLGAIEEFRSKGQFVLCWGTEYWMSKAGEITDT